jgi:hypothetical protein
MAEFKRGAKVTHEVIVLEQGKMILTMKTAEEEPDQDKTGGQHTLHIHC